MARPVVALLHGFLGFVRWGPFEYFRGVSQALHQANVAHLMPEVPSAGTVAERAETLARKLLPDNIPTFGLVANSMGGLDARYLITHLDPDRRVKSLLTVSTPHRGSPSRTWMLESRGPIPGWFAIPAAGFEELTPEACAGIAYPGPRRCKLCFLRKLPALHELPFWLSPTGALLPKITTDWLPRQFRAMGGIPWHRARGPYGASRMEPGLAERQIRETFRSPPFLETGRRRGYEPPQRNNKPKGASMDQNEDRKWAENGICRGIDWLVFVVPTFLSVLGWSPLLVPRTASGMGPSIAISGQSRTGLIPYFSNITWSWPCWQFWSCHRSRLSYIQSMTNRKERQLHREVPAERRGEIRRRMGRRASFSTYRGSVWLTTTVVLLGISILLLFKPVSSAEGMGVDFSLGANMLTMGPFAELFEKNPDAYYSHLVRNLIAFQFGFLGAYVYFIGSVVRAYFTLDLTSHTFVDGAIRMIVASILALVLSFVFDFAFP